MLPESPRLTQSPGTVGHRWRRLHCLTWVIVLLVLSAMTIVVVPVDVSRYAIGMPLSNYSNRQRPQVVREYRCGWPLHYITIFRGFGGTGRPAYTRAADLQDDQVRWLSRFAWPLGADEYQWSWRGLLANLAAVLAIVAAAAAGCEFWIRRRGGRVRLTIRDMLVVTAVLAGAFGWGAWHRSCVVFEGEVVEQLIASNALFENPKSMYGPFHMGIAGGLDERLSWNDSDIFYRRGIRTSHLAPQWLVRLVGSERSLANFRHPTGLIIDPAKLSEGDWDALASLAHLQQLRFVDVLSDRDLSRLKEMTWLRSIAFDERRMSVLAYPRNPSVGRERDVIRLAELHQLESVELSINGVTAETLEALLALPNLERIAMQGLYVSEADRVKLEAFRDRHPELDIEMRW
jgi:hypothetical protein